MWTYCIFCFRNATIFRMYPLHLFSSTFIKYFFTQCLCPTAGHCSPHRIRGTWVAYYTEQFLIGDFGTTSEIVIDIKKLSYKKWVYSLWTVVGTLERWFRTTVSFASSTDCPKVPAEHSREIDSSLWTHCIYCFRDDAILRSLFFNSLIRILLKIYVLYLFWKV